MKFIISLAFLLLLSQTSGRTCVHPRRTTPARCVNPPVVRRVDLPAYAGLWFNTYVSGSAREFALDCVTANYTLNTDGKISVLNCNFNSSQPRPACLAGVATRRPGLPSSRLQVSFGPGRPGPYNVAALLGRKNYGYFAAAVYTCVLVSGVPREGLFIIARAPFVPGFILRKLTERLRCKGYQLQEFVQITHNRRCQYLNGGAGFDTFGLPAFPRLPIP